MKYLRQMMCAAAIGMTAVTALAQPGQGPGPGAGTGGGAGPGAGMGAGAGPGAGANRMGPGAAARWGADETAGWSLMTRQERAEHRDRMRAMKTREACTAYQSQHYEQMTARARERGRTLEPARRDGCAGMKP